MNHTIRAKIRRVARAAVAALMLFPATVLPITPVGADTIQAYPSFAFKGAGYGHGIGLSQYGAKGFAERGRTGQWIAAYYFPGTAIGQAPSERTLTSNPLNINLDKAKNARSSWQIRPGYTGAKLKINGEVLPDSTYTFTRSGSAVVVKNSAGTQVGSYTGDITVAYENNYQALLQVVDKSGPYDHAYVKYRGWFILSANGSGVKLVNRLSMQDYLKGVVPRESPASWHIEALKAQAIAARSYAYNSTGELYCTTSSQVYNGHSKGSDRDALDMHEHPNSNTAVDETNAQYVMYGGKVVQTFFHSSSGGHTADIETVWSGTSEPSSLYPYRKGVDDPYCVGPYDPWPSPVTLDGMQLAQKIAPKVNSAPTGAGSSIYVRSMNIDRVWPSGFARTVDITWSNNAVSRGVTGDTVRSALGLRSTKFFLNGGHYTRVSAPNRYETAVKVSQAAFPSVGDAKAAVIVNGADERFPDALTAAGLAGVAEGPVLLVQGGSVPQVVAEEIRRLQVSKLYVVGGEPAVSESVLSSLAGIVPDTERVAGVDRYGTGAAVAHKMRSLGAVTDDVLIASGENWPDAAIAAAVSAGTGRPLLLVRKDEVPAATIEALTSLTSPRMVVFGGSAVISAAMRHRLTSIAGGTAPVKVFGEGGNRYNTAAEAAKWCVSDLGYRMSNVYVSSGETFVDAVTGSSLAGKNKNPMVLTNNKTPSGPTAAFFSANRAAINTVTIVGGPGAITDPCASALAGYAY
ncbi:MAG: cell wall-binding repeat-containing protein [Coriobacteriia bacterium]|nr:cell wall-binding repeat-containing protein [Coriobacteriia bacterium]